MRLNDHPQTALHTHLIPEHTPRSTPIPGPLLSQSHYNTYEHSSNHGNDGNHDKGTFIPTYETALHSVRTFGRGTVGETMPISTNFSCRNNSQPDFRPYSSNNNSSVYLHSSSKSHNGSVNNLRYISSSPGHHIPPPRFDNDVSSKHSMTTDDDNSSSASFRQRPRQASKASLVPSPLGGGASSYPGTKSQHINSNSISSSTALSNFSSLSSAEKNNTAISSDMGINSSTNAKGKAPSQLRVRHLERDSSYAGYLTKFSSRTFFSRKQWKRRYFILDQKSLHCFKSSDPQHPLLETITLSAETIICVTDIFAGKRYCLQISCPGEKNWYVLADTASEMSGWLRELKGTVQRVRNLQLDSRPETLYSDSSEVSEMSSASLAVRVPQVPTIPSQYEFVSGQLKHLPSSTAVSSSSFSTSLPSRHVQQSSYQSQHQQHLSPYQGHTSLNPPPRSITPKPSTPTPGSAPRRPQDTQGYSYGAVSQSQGQPEMTRRRNGSLSAGQAAPDYASFGSVMERAETMAAAQRDNNSSSWSIPTKLERPGSSFGAYATIPRSKRESTMSSMSSMSDMSTAPTSHRVSVVAERPTDPVTLPQRNAQRLTGSFTRPMSPISHSSSSRPMSPNLGRTSPRSSLVISPPPRSVHRPASVSIRHSTQILPPPQIMTAGLSSSRSSIITSPLSSNPPTSSLPATPDTKPSSGHGSLSRITSIRHQQQEPGLNRQSVINIGLAKVGSSGTSTMGSLQERVQRNSSRTSVMRSPITTSGVAVKLGIEPSVSNRPLSPAPSLASAPTQPLPEPPRAGSNSPSMLSSSSGSSHQASTSLSPSTTDGNRQAHGATTTRHHEPDLPLPNRSKARPRSQSQEDPQLSAKLGDIQLSRRSTTPSPRLNPIVSSTPMSTSTPTSSLTSTSASHSTAETNNHPQHSSGSNHQKHMSLPIQNAYVLPAPPTRQTPARPLNQRPSGSSSALRPISTMLSNVPSLGGGVARRSSSGTNASKGPHTPSRDSILSPSERLSSLILLPPEPTTAVPLPPPEAAAANQSTSSQGQGGNHLHGLPAPPTSALPKKPVEKNVVQEIKIKQVGFDMILEEEEEEEEEYDDEEGEGEGEFVRRLQFEELEAVKELTETDAEQDSGLNTPTTPRRPEYYATKESKVVEYIFPSESNRHF
ncbi:hypothetical protein BGX28_007821 [Mortierella sp. GBA30]|nr:hypothetical protein BGX28_007821 [Mortierella sp. GBA30]